MCSPFVAIDNKKLKLSSPKDQAKQQIKNIPYQTRLNPIPINPQEKKMLDPSNSNTTHNVSNKNKS
jgi:hypothetical protein